MIRMQWNKIIKLSLDSVKYIPKRRSALFINGTKATDTYVFVIPHIDFQERIKQKDIIENDLKKRKSKIDLEKIQDLWSMYESLKEQKQKYDDKKTEVSTKLGGLIKSDPNNELIKKLKIEHSLLKDNIRKLKAPLWSAEEAATLEALKLPNALHSDTPSEDDKVLYTHLTPPITKRNHLKIAHDQNLLQFKKNDNYYLKGNAAIFELGAKFYFSDILKKNAFIQFSNPDFAKSVIIEGCGFDHRDPDSTFLLHHNDNTKLNIDNRLHLTGGGSLYSFMAYYATNVLYGKVLPLKQFAMGRQYVPSSSDEDSLFHVSQSSVIKIFGAARNTEDLNVFLYDLIELLKSSYSELGYHFIIKLEVADKLHMWEALRVTVNMYSSSLEKYIEIANVSVSGDFISKRLMFTFMENKKSHYPHLLSGTIMNVPKFLGCVLEQDQEFVLPKQFLIDKWCT